MTFVTDIEDFVETTEADVVKWVAAIKADVAIAESDINAALKWVAGQTPAIASAIESVLGLVEQIGVGSNPEVAIAITAANTAVTALNAFASAENSGASAKDAVVAGYVAVKQAQASTAAAMAAAASSKAVPAAKSVTAAKAA